MRVIFIDGESTLSGRHESIVWRPMRRVCQFPARFVIATSGGVSFTKLMGSQADLSFELLREGALVTEAKVDRDPRDRFAGIQQGVAGGLNACLVQEFLCAHPENLLKPAMQLSR